MKATRTMHFDATPDEVLAFVFDDAIPAEGETMEPIHVTPGRVGDSYAWTFRFLGTRHRGVTIITDYVPGQRLAFRNFGLVQGTARWSVQPEAGGTRATVQAQTRLAIPLVGRLLDPMLQRMFDKDLANGKRKFTNQHHDTTTAA